jgi:hypothetical protein
MRSHFLLIPACLFWAMPSAADELPKRKPGLWEIKMVVSGRELPLQNIQQCTDAETDSLMTSNLAGPTGGRCEKPTITNRGGTITVDSTCKIGATATRTRAVITGDFDRAYTIKVTSPDGGPQGDPAVTMEAKWIGACRQGQRPGDIVMPGGIKMNVRELAIGTGVLQRQ